MKHLRVARIGLVLLLLALGFVGLSRPASAAGAAPSDLKVGTSYQPHSGSIVALPSVPFKVEVVNGGGVPVTSCPYAGFHLNYISANNTCGSSPETNTITGVSTGAATDTTTTETLFWTPYKVRNFDALMWCGQAGGIAEGNFKVRVTVNPGGNNNQITVGGVTKSGKWNILAYEYGGGNFTNTATNTNSIEAVAYNPYTTLVLFNFVEDPPTTPSLIFTGKMVTNKYYNGGDPTLATTYAPDVNNANVKITNSINNWAVNCTSGLDGCPSGANGTFNPFTYQGLYQCETNKYAYNCGAAKYKNTVTVPTGYKVNSVTVTYDLTTSNPAGTIPGIYAGIPAWPNEPTTFTCTGPDNTGFCSVGGTIDTSTNKGGLWVLGYWVGCTNNCVQTNWREYATRVLWRFVDATPTTYKYPWLQTTQGNVVANGKISGNIASDTLVGNRAATPTTTAKEAEFLIISKVGGGGPFCSNKNYILTNSLATGGSDCGNGLGYSVLNVDSVAGTEDKVVAGVKDAYNALPQPNGTTCKGTATSSTEFTNLAPLLNRSATDCPNGVIIKYTNGAATATTYLESITPVKGRVTILVENNLVLSDDPVYGTTGYTDPRDVPNLAFVVKGNIGVANSITKVDASLYATGTISTCQYYLAFLCPALSSQLVVNGFMSAQQGFRFGRVFTNGSRDAAEVINLTLQSVVYPPPGIDYSSVFKGDSSVKIDPSEYPPRF
ncbi:hypothetical protein EXS53_01615 [Patescibacteria group bacterium]|nr:hypothetical protein [Patescibacteria group bacterium]